MTNALLVFIYSSKQWRDKRQNSSGRGSRVPAFSNSISPRNPGRVCRGFCWRSVAHTSGRAPSDTRSRSVWSQESRVFWRLQNELRVRAALGGLKPSSEDLHCSELEEDVCTSSFVPSDELWELSLHTCRLQILPLPSEEVPEKVWDRQETGTLLLTLMRIYEITNRERSQNVMAKLRTLIESYLFSKL